VSLPPKKPRLGGGLDALIPAAKPKVLSSAQGFSAPIEEVFANRGQPRSHFAEEALEELTQSIREMGVLEPILVRKRPQGGYEIVAGERRWRAAQRAGLHEVPVFVRDLGNAQAFEAALVENLQREDLNPLETARAFQRLIDEHNHTQETIAKRVGKDRSTVANALRLLKLPESVLAQIGAGALSEGHGRALLGAGNAKTIEKLAAAAVAKQWSVRETERRRRRVNRVRKRRRRKARMSATSRSASRARSGRAFASKTRATAKARSPCPTLRSTNSID
jgi:ParB family transcriptional regulator, chromosome partitioning protein